MKGRRSPSELETLWKERDLSGGREVDAMVMIMRTGGCAWAATGGCTMCGYRQASVAGVTADDLLRQLDRALDAYGGEPFVKIYTSGSFLDDDEVPPAVRERILAAFAGCERILIESRPEFVTPERLAQLPGNVTLALGLESSDPEVLSRAVNKGFTPEDSRRAGLAARAASLQVRTYLLLKPPFLTEAAAIADTVASALFADGFSDEISINPLNIQNRTPAERLWRQGELRSPWLWTLTEVLRRLSGQVGARLMSSPSGGGTQRGAHNCGECDRRVLDAVERFSLTQDVRALDVTCGCIADWKRYIDAEGLLGTPADLERGFENTLAVGK